MSISTAFDDESVQAPSGVHAVAVTNAECEPVTAASSDEYAESAMLLGTACSSHTLALMFAALSGMMC